MCFLFSIVLVHTIYTIKAVGVFYPSPACSLLSDSLAAGLEFDELIFLDDEAIFG